MAKNMKPLTIICVMSYKYLRCVFGLRFKIKIFISSNATPNINIPKIIMPSLAMNFFNLLSIGSLPPYCSPERQGWFIPIGMFCFR